MKTAMKHYKDYWNKGMGYNDYRTLIDELLDQGKATSEIENVDVKQYTELNVTRMKRLDKTTIVLDDLLSTVHGLPIKPVLLSITEGWCGDAAQILPVLEKFSAEAGLQSRFVLRDENPELIDQHLTNGGRSIPIVLFLHPETFESMGTWGPRPAPAQKLLMDWKQHPEPRPDMGELKTAMQLWYTRDKQVTMQQEWNQLLSTELKRIREVSH